MARTRPTVFHIEQNDEIIVPNGGQAIIGRLIDLTEIRKRFNSLRTIGQKSPKFTGASRVMHPSSRITEARDS